MAIVGQEVQRHVVGTILHASQDCVTETSNEWFIIKRLSWHSESTLTLHEGRRSMPHGGHCWQLVAAAGHAMTAESGAAQL